MNFVDYTLAASDDSTARLSRAWLKLGLFSLIAPGVFAILLVAARFPGLQGGSGWADFFKTALVLHVDLSIVAWFLAFGAVLWSWGGAAKWTRFGWTAFWLAVLGVAAMSFAPLAMESRPLLNNYVPVLQQPVFFVGLVLFGSAVAMVVVRALAAIRPLGIGAGQGAARLGLIAAAVTTLVAIVAFIWSFVAIPEAYEGHAYYELLFWGGGHVLQFTYTLLAMVAWCWLASASGLALAVGPRVLVFVLALGFAPVWLVPVVYLLYDVASVEHRIFFTLHMQYAGGLGAIPLMLIVLYSLLRGAPAQSAQQPPRAALWVSVLLFASGGVIGFMISGVNVTIPAHYHGSIIGVTLAFMGVTYALLPALGYGEPNVRWARVQPWLLGGGQFLHVLGLAWLGGYGVQRKVADGSQAVDAMERLARGVMNVGGLLAVIGGVIFLVVVFAAMRRRRV